MVNACLGFLNEENSPFDLKNNHIVLIPKVEHPIRITMFRLISLCNVPYKIIFKVLANRLKRVLGIM